MSLNLDPKDVNLDKLLAGPIEFDTQYQIRHGENLSTPIQAFAYFRQRATKLVCLLPSAQPSGTPQQNPIFHRWTWFTNFPDAHVMVFSDPGLYRSQELRAAWFMDGETDIIKRLSEFVSRSAEALGIELDEVYVYGSSMGGFGALMLAAELRQAVAIAEVPQLDMRTYPILGAVRDLEELALGCTLSDYYELHPERVSVISRFISTGVVPRFKLITNCADTAFEEHLRFVSSVRQQVPEAQIVSDFEVLVLGEDIGHRPLPTERGVSVLKAVLTTPPRARVGLQLSAVSNRSYRELVDAAVEVIGRIRFIRTPSDFALYKEAKGLLYAAADADASADWPFRRLCSLIKLWTGGFDEELLLAAKKGFSRNESLESFIYLCRGLITKHQPIEAEEMILEATSRVSDSDTRNVGRIFQALCRYELDDFYGYSKLIDEFRSNKSKSFSPYLSIPVSTVVTVVSSHLDSAPVGVGMLGLALDEVPLSAQDSRYVVTVSCDESYFRLYGSFLVSSFSKFCSTEATLLLSVITPDIAPLRRLLESWGAVNVVLQSIDFQAELNIGPLASLVRFCTVYPLLKALGLPVVVLDIDCVITAPLGRLIESHNGADICARILGRGASPWEKYTGGFAVFYPTRLGADVAGYVASAASMLACDGKPQWWIDQNCFEAGIRMVRMRGDHIRIDNLISERDEYCVMPEGSRATKELILEGALNGITAD